jgi:hypothetical protein
MDSLTDIAKKLRTPVLLVSGLLLIDAGQSELAAAAAGGAVLSEFSLPDHIGYVARPCGFDLDRDGDEGEPADCILGREGVTDPDGDGIDEVFIYVDCGATAYSAQRDQWRQGRAE